MENKHIDPVCGMEVDPKNAAAEHAHGGVTYYFCSPGCKTAFAGDPEKYLGGQGSAEHHHHHEH